MDIDLSTKTFDQEVRHYVYDQTMKEGRSPTVAETAVVLSTTPAEVQLSLQRLADAHMLVLQRDKAASLCRVLEGYGRDLLGWWARTRRAGGDAVKLLAYQP